jgi:serine/threonine protein kinase
MIFIAVEMVAKSKKELSLKSKNRPFTYAEVVSITNNFRTVIGEGGFGKVYSGILNDDTQVAVKLLSPSSKQGYKEFRAEVRYNKEITVVNQLKIMLFLETIITRDTLL